MTSYLSKEDKLAFLAMSLMTLLAAGPIPPPDVKTQGKNDPPT